MDKLRCLHKIPPQQVRARGREELQNIITGSVMASGDAHTLTSESQEVRVGLTTPTDDVDSWRDVDEALRSPMASTAIPHSGQLNKKDALLHIEKCGQLKEPAHLCSLICNLLPISSILTIDPSIVPSMYIYPTAETVSVNGSSQDGNCSSITLTTSGIYTVNM